MPINPRSIQDQIAMFNSVRDIRVPAFRVIDLIQDAHPRDQILGIATALLAVCEALQLNPHDLISKVERAKNHIDGPFQLHYGAIKAYAQGELTK